MKNVNKSYRVVVFKGLSGEHHSLLVDEFGFPDWWSTRWIIEGLRQTGHASSTITAKLRAVQMLYMAVPKASELSDRLAKGQWLTPAEADHLLDQMTYPAQQINSFPTSLVCESNSSEQKTPALKKIVSLESMRSKLKTTSRPTVNSQTKALRLLFIREYLSWRANQHLMQMRGEKKAELAKEIDAFDNYIEQRTNTTKNNTLHHSAKGLSDDELQALHEAIDPKSLRNVWKNNKFIRLRNQLIVELMLCCGIRRGAVLGINMEDIDAMSGRISILRRPDDPADTREVQTGNKRTEYLIPLEHRVRLILKAYEVQRHKIVSKTKSKTPYLIISEYGNPLEQSSVNYLVKSLRKIEELKNIHPHFFRHAWANNYVRLRVKDEDNIDKIEDDLRTLGGWSEKSDMPARYTRYYREQSSFEASLRLQSMSVPLRSKEVKK